MREQRIWRDGASAGGRGGQFAGLVAQDLDMRDYQRTSSDAVWVRGTILLECDDDSSSDQQGF